MNIFKMEVNKKVIDPVTKEGNYVVVGSVEVPMFSLKEFGIDVEPTGSDTGTPEAPGTGLLIYADPKVQFAYDALCAATKADARNKLVSGTANLKPGAKIADTVDELIAKAERSGAALAIAREFLASFAKYLADKSGKSAAVQTLYNQMAKNRQTIALSSQARKDGMLHQLTAYMEQASEEEAAKYANILIAIEELCSKEFVIDDTEL